MVMQTPKRKNANSMSIYYVSLEVFSKSFLMIDCVFAFLVDKSQFFSFQLKFNFGSIDLYVNFPRFLKWARSNKQVRIVEEVVSGSSSSTFTWLRHWLTACFLFLWWQMPLPSLTNYTSTMLDFAPKGVGGG
jgi:hypothetical protein